jgi:hypothetical protein
MATILALRGRTSTPGRWLTAVAVSLRGGGEQQPGRLIPVWYVVTTVGLLAVLTLVFAGLVATTDGIEGLAALSLVVATGLLFVAALSSRDPVVPITASDVPAEQLIDEIQRTQAAAARR